MPATGPQHILVVDDEPLVCASICMLLCVDGHRVTLAESGEEALAKFDPSRFDLVLTDFKMPGMKGDQLAREIKSRAPSMPVIMVTGFPPNQTPPEIDYVVLKPFHVEELRQALAHVAAQPPSPSVALPT